MFTYPKKGKYFRQIIEIKQNWAHWEKFNTRLLASPDY